MNNKLSGTFRKPNKIYIYTLGDIFKLNDICRKPKATDYGSRPQLEVKPMWKPFSAISGFCLFVWSNYLRMASDLHSYQLICICTMFIKLACKSSIKCKMSF